MRGTALVRGQTGLPRLEVIGSFLRTKQELIGSAVDERLAPPFQLPTSCPSCCLDHLSRA